MTRITISTDWHPSERSGRAVQFYYLNGECVSTLLRDVAKRIRTRVAVPNAVIKRACLRAKETEEAVRLRFVGDLGPRGEWRVQ